MFNKFRQIAGDDNLPIIVGELGHFLRKDTFMSYPDTINDILYEISENDPVTGLVSAEGLEHKGDFLHFNSESLRILGKRYAEEFSAIEKLSKQTSK